MTNHGQTEEDTRDRNMWTNLVLGKGKPSHRGQSLDLKFVLYGCQVELTSEEYRLSMLE
jgi:hypothetical protein